MPRKGLDIASPREFDRVFEGCVLGKSHRLPFLKESTTTYDKCEVLVVDTTGPMTDATWLGMWYALVIVEVSCRFGVGDILPGKEQMKDSLLAMVVKLERQSGLKVRIICLDNRLEFVNSVLEEICKARKITHQTTVPYMPEHNGIAERAIAIYFDMVRCMLHSAGMALRYWGKVTGVHVRRSHPQHVRHVCAQRDGPVRGGDRL